MSPSSRRRRRHVGGRGKSSASSVYGNHKCVCYVVFHPLPVRCPVYNIRRHGDLQWPVVCFLALMADAERIETAEIRFDDEDVMMI
jgi:hypothetical protein